MGYDKKEFRRDLFFILGYFRSSIGQDKDINWNKKRLERFEEYCFKNFSR